MGAPRCAAVRWLIFALWVALFVGCSVMVPSTLDEGVRCNDDGTIGAPACAPAEVCAHGLCTACRTTEACADGVDNDCNGMIDDGCPDAGGSDGGALALPTIGQQCNPVDGCQTGSFCLDPSLFNAPGAAFCTKACCTSADCETGAAVCIPTPGGAAMCWPGDRIGRNPPGTAASGAACGSGGDCRSGLCEQGACIDTCCAEADCGGLAPDCTLRSVTALTTSGFACGTARGSGGFETSCFFGDSACRTNLCLQLNGLACSKSCCTTSDCGGSWECGYTSHGGSMVRACIAAGTAGNGQIGEPCTNDSDCGSAWCLTLPNGSRCTDACCGDANCPSGFLCRPGLKNSAVVLRCEAIQ